MHNTDLKLDQMCPPWRGEEEVGQRTSGKELPGLAQPRPVGPDCGLMYAVSSMCRRASRRKAWPEYSSTDWDAQDEPLETPEVIQAPADTSSQLRSRHQQNSFLLPTAPGTVRCAHGQEEGFPQVALPCVTFSCITKRPTWGCANPGSRPAWNWGHCRDKK